MTYTAINKKTREEAGTGLTKEQVEQMKAHPHTKGKYIFQEEKTAKVKAKTNPAPEKK